jgi:hypothetical protein
MYVRLDEGVHNNIVDPRLIPDFAGLSGTPGEGGSSMFWGGRDLLPFKCAGNFSAAGLLSGNYAIHMEYQEKQGGG